MIKTFSVTNFKNFKDKITIDFSKKRDYTFNQNLIKNGLVNKALIYGYNSSGKSNLGFAIMDITSHLTDKVKANGHYNYPINLNSNKNYSTFCYEFLFNGQTIKYEYSKNINRELLFEEIFINDESVFYYDYTSKDYRNDLKDIKSINLDNRVEHISVLKYIRNNFLDFDKNNPIKLIVDFANDMLWFRSLRQDEFMGKITNGDDISNYIIKNNYVEDFQNFLSECDVKEKLCKLLTPAGEILGVEKGKNIVPFFSICSTGTASLSLFYYWKISCFNKIKFLYLDEFDAFYHEKLSVKLLEILYKDTNFQCVVTTHNASLATNELVRPDCVMILKDNHIKSLSDLTNKVLREGHNLRKLMEAGEFDK